MISLSIIYACVFVVGPYGFLRLVRRCPSKRQFIGLACIAAGTAAMSFSLRYLSGGWGQNAIATVVGIALIWFAWIAILAFVAQSIRQRDRHAVVRRWTAIIGAIATTIPWFGLATARMMNF